MFSTPLAILGLAAAVAQAKVQFLGVSISGGDFGCTIDGSCPTGQVQLPLSSLGGGDGQGQMNHFAKDDGMNMFRLPVSWQFLANNQPGGTLDARNLGRYDQVVQACLATGAHCMIDIHNFARWNGKVIGQGGPSDDDFAGLWRQLAAKYAANERVVFELMNEPHDLDVAAWARTCQAAVTAIRQAGAAKQMILLPGTNFDSAATLVSSGSADALMAVRNPDGTTDGLLLDIHKYLDVDNSGTHRECTTDNRAAFAEVAAYLRKAGRKGLVSETGASLDGSCMTAFCSQNALINENADVFVGLVGWAAGSFPTSYILSMTPSRNGNALVDNAITKQCLIETWLNAKAVSPSPSAAPAPSSTLAPAPAVSSATAPPSSVAPPASSLPPVIPAPPASASSSAPLSSSSSSSSSSTALFVASSTVLLVAPPRSSSNSGSLSSSSSKPAYPTRIVPSEVLGTDAAATKDSAAPTTLLVAAGTPPARAPYGGVSGVRSSNGSTSVSSPSPPASSTRPPIAAGAGSVWQPAAATSLVAVFLALAALFV